MSRRAAFQVIAVFASQWLWCTDPADPYIQAYASLPNLGYVDMGIESDLIRAKKAFPYARRAVMYTPMDLADRTMDQIRTDLERVALQYGPCDLVVADIETDTPDERVLAFWKLCKQLSRRYG